MTQKIIILALSFLAFSHPSFALVTKTTFQEQGKEGVRFDVEVDALQFYKSKLSNRDTLQGVRLKGVEPYSGILYRPGFPKLPVIRFLVQGSVEVTLDESKVYERQLPPNTRIEPSLAPVQKRPGHKFNLTFDDKAYQSNTYAPSTTYTVVTAGSKEGMPLQLVTLHPMSYEAKSGNWIFRKKFTVTAKRPILRIRQDQQPLLAFVVGAKFAKSAALAQYAAFKQKLGFRVSMGVMGKDFNSGTEIRNWLKKQLASGLKYAVLIGDLQDIPSYTSKHISGVTDHFYRAIDTDDYEKDINGPDIGVGRVAIADEAQLTAVLAKFTRYQSSQARARSNDWLKSISLIATDDQYEIAEGTHNWVIQNYTKKLGFTGSFPNASSAAGGDKLYAITHAAETKDLIKAFEEGRVIINYSGHGGTTSWAGPEFEPSDVRNLKNPDALPFVIGNACDTAAFSTAESFGETWLRQPGAAIAYWGSFDSSYWEEDDILEKKMYDGVFQFGTRAMGDFTNYALSAFWNHYGGQGKSMYYWETYVLFGDPSIQLRSPARW